MTYLRLNGIDVSHLVKGLRIGYETLVAENSGRNANGDTVLDVINHKVKVYVTFRPMDGSDMSSLLSAIDDFVFPVTFWDSRKNGMTTITCYSGTPEPEYYWILNDQTLYKEMNLNFIEM